MRVEVELRGRAIHFSDVSPVRAQPALCHLGNQQCAQFAGTSRLGLVVPVENNGPRVDEAAGRRGGQSAMMIKSIISKQVGLASIEVVEQLSCERHDWRAFDMRAGAANPVQHHEIEGWNSSEQGMGRQYRLTSPIVGSCDIGVRNSRKRIAYDLELRINDLLGSIKTESQSPPTDVQALHELLNGASRHRANAM